jgi:hypothetical protein
MPTDVIGTRRILGGSKVVTDYAWKPITPLSAADRAVDLAAMRPLYQTWQVSKDRLQQSSPASLGEFNRQLVRRLSIETGILERLYDLDRGTTDALIAKGFVEELVSRSSTDIDPSRLIDILRDQEAAVQLVIDCVARKRALTKSLIHELHSVTVNDGRSRKVALAVGSTDRRERKRCASWATSSKILP